MVSAWHIRFVGTRGSEFIATRSTASLIRTQTDAEFETRMLRHNFEGQIVAGAAGVPDLEVGAIAGEYRTVGQVTEGARDRIRRGIVNHSENCARRQRAAASINEGKRHAASPSLFLPRDFAALRFFPAWRWRKSNESATINRQGVGNKMLA
jgi:hypothetical protein